jgi:hypothetical protein
MDQEMRGTPRNFPIVQEDTATRDGHEAGNRLDERRFAGAIRSEERQYLVLRNLKRRAVDDGKPRLIARFERIDPQSRHATAPPR